MTTLVEHKPEDVWQAVFASGTHATGGPFQDTFPAVLDDGRQILLPVRALPDGVHAVASLIVNQASFAVVDALAEDLAGKLRPHAPDIVIGLPTLGLTLAAETARKLGHTRYVPLGTSRKFWYREEWSVPISSITTPDQAKRLYVDPRMLPLLVGQRVALIDDAVSTGTSMAAALRLLDRIGVRPVAIGAAMLQTERWRAALRDAPGIVRCFDSPLLRKAEDGWQAAAF